MIIRYDARGHGLGGIVKGFYKILSPAVDKFGKARIISRMNRRVSEV